MSAQDRKPLRERYPIAGVRRANLSPTVLAGGRVESAKRTVIRCQLENWGVGARGGRVAMGGASTLIWLVPAGSVVQRGDILAVLDSSEYDELLRLQRIYAERSKADRLRAQLDLEVSNLAVRKFREGTMTEVIAGFRGRVALARAGLERARARLDWSRGMKAKGYVSAGAVQTEESSVARAEEALKIEESAFNLFQRYTAPKTLRALEGTVLGAEAILRYHELRTERSLSRLARLERQVENCTIRAPHDGFVVHAHGSRRGISIEEGMPVRQLQCLFYLPDLDDMEIVAQLHESIVDGVRPGLRARVHIESLPGRHLEGRVTLVAPLATFEWHSEVRYLDAVVKLDESSPGLRPGMTARIEIAMPGRENVLAVPTEAVTRAGGRDVCLVLREAGLERREVRLGAVTPSLTEIQDGLREGEQVVLGPQVEATDFATSPIPADVADREDHGDNEGAPRISHLDRESSARGPGLVGERRR
jgi:HlyD family secretion protein